MLNSLEHPVLLNNERCVQTMTSQFSPFDTRTALALPSQVWSANYEILFGNESSNSDLTRNVFRVDQKCSGQITRASVRVKSFETVLDSIQ
jgi:hypothetical protein